MTFDSPVWRVPEVVLDRSGYPSLHRKPRRYKLSAIAAGLDVSAVVSVGRAALNPGQRRIHRAAFDIDGEIDQPASDECVSHRFSRLRSAERDLCGMRCSHPVRRLTFCCTQPRCKRAGPMAMVGSSITDSARLMVATPGTEMPSGNVEKVCRWRLAQPTVSNCSTFTSALAARRGYWYPALSRSPKFQVRYFGTTLSGNISRECAPRRHWRYRPCC